MQIFRFRLTVSHFDMLRSQWRYRTFLNVDSRIQERGSDQYKLPRQIVVYVSRTNCWHTTNDGNGIANIIIYSARSRTVRSTSAFSFSLIPPSFATRRNGGPRCGYIRCNYLNHSCNNRWRWQPLRWGPQIIANNFFRAEAPLRPPMSCIRPSLSLSLFRSWSGANKRNVTNSSCFRNDRTSSRNENRPRYAGIFYAADSQLFANTPGMKYGNTKCTCIKWNVIFGVGKTGGISDSKDRGQKFCFGSSIFSGKVFRPEDPPKKITHAPA